MTTLIGFSTSQKKVLEADIVLARQLAMRAVNSLVLTSSGRPGEKTAQLAWWVFTVESDSRFWDRVEPIKNVYLSFAGRSETVSIKHDASPPAANVIEFDAYVPPGFDNLMFIRNEYFKKQPRDRAVTLIHESVHLRFRDNPGDGHPGGQIIMFQPGNIQIGYDDAIRNAYCYQYYADWISM